MHSGPDNPARRGFIARAAGIAGMAALAAAAGRSPPAAAKAAKSEFLYQDHRHEGKSCGQCKFFTPGDGRQDVGSCAIVEGAISRDGWCMAFAPRVLA